MSSLTKGPSTVGRTSPVPKPALIYFFGALGGILFGYETGIIAGALSYIYKTPGFSQDALTTGLIVGGISIGAIVGAVSAGRLSDRIGRRRVLLALGIVFIVGSVVCAVVPNSGALIAGRVFLGLGVGGCSALVPVYLSEMAPAKARGGLAGLNQLMIVTGLLLGYCVNFLLANTENWRLMLASGALPALLLVAGLPVLPESPRWLMTKGRTEEAARLLYATRSAEEAASDIEAISRVDARSSHRELLARWVRPAVIVGVGIPVLCQATGLNMVTYYAPTIFESLNLPHENALVFTIILGTIKVVSVAIGLQFIDRVGRRTLLVGGSACMAICMAAMAFEAGKGDQVNAMSMLIAMSVMFVSYSLTWGPVNWVVLGEIFPLRVRGAAMGMASMVTWFATLAVTFGFPLLRESIGLAGTMVLFVACNIVGFLFCLKFVPETKGRSLEQIEQDLHDRHDAKVAATTH
ncbi:sugar porter family MFS transporter [Pseudarthrobacter sp. efr-133-R2A-89]|uniref:sugar porter family MFS transporter n=1 Tax=Pseudarthrobacter sp. efr-133-R2A-89 TaxID=3040302 RepID=UPI0025571C77|nr:sugar porter family MFS transporter [Pseudarthrobacter sp. efr-133-R2A-89]